MTLRPEYQNFSMEEHRATRPEYNASIMENEDGPWYGMLFYGDGFVCDVLADTYAEVSAFLWEQIKRGAKP